MVVHVALRNKFHIYIHVPYLHCTGLGRLLILLFRVADSNAVSYRIGFIVDDCQEYVFVRLEAWLLSLADNSIPEF